MPEVVDWPMGESNALLTQAMGHLREGRLVVFPTGSGYTVATGALAPNAYLALDQGIGSEPPLHLLLGQAVEIFDWLPTFRGVGPRLARRFWPGPLTLVSGTGLDRGLYPRLPEPVRKRLAPHRKLSFRLAHHEFIQQCSQSLGMPLLAAETSWSSLEQIAASCGDKVPLIIKDEQTPFSQSDTVVQVHGRDWQMLKEGAIAAREIKEAALCRILFICTGNTCRSPLAEGLCQKLLADHLGCLPEQLLENGFLVQSAGLAAMMGEEANPEAIAIAREHGANLADHVSQPLSIELLQDADFVFAMTAGHLRTLQGIRGLTPRLLSPEGNDVADPIGGSPEIYRECASQIKNYLEVLVPEFLEC
jgi:L-threonylcarbamoyladenylate synthase